MKDKFLRITTDVFGDEIDAWLNNTKVLTYEQKEELILKGETMVQRTESSYTSYKLVKSEPPLNVES